MPERAGFDSFILPGFPQAIEIVPAADVEQRVVIFGPGARIATSAAKATSAGYVVTTQSEPFYLAARQSLYAAASSVAFVGIRISVYVAPREDDYLESGQIWQATDEETEEMAHA